MYQRGLKKLSPPERDALVREYRYERTIDRLYYISLVLAGLFAVYGLTSFEFIHLFSPDTSIFNNVWPRILFNTVPMLGLATYLRKSKSDRYTKIRIWFTIFCAVYDLACMIIVWPVAWSGQPSIMLYVNSVNLTTFFAIAMLLAMNAKEAIYPVLIAAICFWLPLLLVVHHGGDQTIFKTILNDTLFLGIAGFLFGFGFEKAETQLATLEIERNIQVAKFLNPLVSKAIFGKDKDVLNHRKTKAVIISTDIRESTYFLSNFGDQYLKFRNDFFAQVSGIVGKYGGHIQKTMGDGHLLNFGVLETPADLSGIPGLEHEEIRAEERRMQGLCDQALRCVDEIFQAFALLASHHFHEKAPRLAAGIAMGIVECGLQGSEDQGLEFDVNGDAVNCSVRLQEHSKIIQSEFSAAASLLVVSPIVSTYLHETGSYQRVSTQQQGVRDYPKIEWVLVRSYSKLAAGKRRAA